MLTSNWWQLKEKIRKKKGKQRKFNRYIIISYFLNILNKFLTPLDFICWQICTKGYKSSSVRNYSEQTLINPRLSLSLWMGNLVVTIWRGRTVQISQNSSPGLWMNILMSIFLFRRKKRFSFWAILTFEMLWKLC